MRKTHPTPKCKEGGDLKLIGTETETGSSWSGLPPETPFLLPHGPSPPLFPHPSSRPRLVTLSLHSLVQVRSNVRPGHPYSENPDSVRSFHLIGAEADYVYELRTGLTPSPSLRPPSPVRYCFPTLDSDGVWTRRSRCSKDGPGGRGQPTRAATGDEGWEA